MSVTRLNPEPITASASYFNGNVRVRRYGDIVVLYMSAVSLTSTGWTDLFYLPENMRPSSMLQVTTKAMDGSEHTGILSVETSGRVRMYQSFQARKSFAGSAAWSV